MANFSKHDLALLLKCMPFVREIDDVPSGLRMETELRYPDGSSIDVFLSQERQDKLDFSGCDLTDFGQTVSWLMEIQLKPWESKKRQRLLEQAIRSLGVDQIGGELRTHARNADELPSAIFRLSQACSRVSDLCYTKRLALPSHFAEQVEEAFSDWELEFEADKEVPGKLGPVKLDFLVYGATKRSAVLTLSSGDTASAHAQSNEIFRKLYDLKDSDYVDSRLTIYDDSKNVYKDEDLSRLNDLSIVAPASNRDAIREAVAA